MDNPKSVYWIKIPLEKENKKMNRIIDFFDFRIESLVLYAADGKKIDSIGHYASFGERNIPHKNFVFSLELNEGKETIYYAKIRVDKENYLSGAIRKFENFNNYSNTEYFFLALFYGILFTLIAYNIIVYFSIKDLTYIYYVAYITSIALLSSSRDNIGFQFLWPNFPQINKYLFPLSELLLVVFAGLYVIRFLELKNKNPWFYKTILTVLGLRIILFATICLFGGKIMYSYWYDVVPLALFFAAGIKARIDGFRSSGYYLIGFAFVLAGFIINIGIDSSLLPANAFTFYSLNAGMILEGFFLSLAIGNKFRDVYEEKERIHQHITDQMKINQELKDKVNIELEEKVQERTFELISRTNELVVSNQKLKELTEKLNEANSRLDNDNWKLNQEVKEKTKDMITSKELGYDDFLNVFPDELSCMRYLDEIKWGNGYTCRKCNNPKYFEGELKFSRKCTRCDYIETIKTHTIFQGIKFPLQKSFYILYLTTNSKRKVTLKELSASIELRMNTCSDFRRKIEKRKDKMKINHWEELVLD
jgi:hypothetical protein